MVPAIIIHHLDHAVCALASLKKIQPLATTPPGCYLLSPQNAAAGLGAALFQSIIAQADEQYPDCVYTGVLDCGAQAGYALAAIRSGLKAVILDGHPRARERMSTIARQNSCQLLDRSLYSDPKPLDLLIIKHADTACDIYLNNHLTLTTETPGI
jgi:hypothetical protein